MVIDPKMSVDLRIDAGGVSAVRTEMGRIGCAAARWTDHMLVCVVSLYVLYRGDMVIRDLPFIIVPKRCIGIIDLVKFGSAPSRCIRMMLFRHLQAD